MFSRWDCLMFVIIYELEFNGQGSIKTLSLSSNMHFAGLVIAL